VLVYVRGKGIVLREPSVVAKDVRTNKTLAVGEEARQMLGRTPSNIQAIRPAARRRHRRFRSHRSDAQLLHQESDEAARFDSALPSQTVGRDLRARRDHERRRTRRARRRETRRRESVDIIEEPMAAAIGAGLPIDGPSGNMVVDIGGGTTDVAVISLGGIVVSQSLRVAGNKLDEAIIRHIRRVYNLMIGERTRKRSRSRSVSAYRLEQELAMEIRGRDLINGLPKTVKITSEEVREALSEPCRRSSKR
jgi:rod shape-determining protein MreB